MSHVRRRAIGPCRSFGSPFALIILSVLAPVPFAALAGAQELAITEFLASNQDNLLDEDGESSDWIEVANLGATAVDIEGWYLTDDATELTKWRFPAVTLGPREYRVVFASGRDRRDPSRELHTNFGLNDEGEFLALVAPDGLTLASAYTPRYPPQFADLSYGIAQDRGLVKLVDVGASVRWLVPSSGGIGTAWRNVGFADSSWRSGTTGLGFDDDGAYGGLIATDLGSAMRGVSASAWVRVPFEIADPSAVVALRLETQYDDGFVAWLNGTEIARRNAPTSLAWNSSATREHGEPQTARLEEDFESATGAWVGTAHGDPAPPRVLAGGPTGSYLELLRDGTGDLSNTIGFDRVFGPSESVKARFDFRMPDESGHTGCCGERADGFGIALLDTGAWGTTGPGPSVANVAWERPRYPDAFAIGFDIFDGSGNENTVSVNWNGVEVASRYVGEFPLNAGVFHRVEFDATANGADSLVTVTITPDVRGGGAPLVLFDSLRVPGMGAFDSRLAFGGRTGGAFTSVDIDNVVVDFSSSASLEVEFEEIDLAGGAALLRAGENVLAIQMLNRSPADGDALLVPVLEAFTGGGTTLAERRYFPEPSPGLPNAGGVLGFSLPPRFSRGPGAFSGSFDLVLSSPTAGATIRYTTNRTEPTGSSPVYTGPIRISATTVVKAKAFEPGLLSSPTVAHGYVAVASGVAGFTSNLPIVVVDTFRQGISDAAQTGVWALVVDTENDGRARLTGIPDFQGSVGMKRRGSSSLGFPKHQWSFEAWDARGDDVDVRILDFPPESDFILHAPYSDKSLLRNYLAYRWSNRIGRYAVRTRFVEVFLESSGRTLDYSDYLGVYVFMEKIKRDDERVDIAELGPADDREPEISGGYIFKKDRLDPGDAGFTTSRGQLLGWVEPKEREVTPAQASWLRNYLNGFENMLYGAAFADPERGYRAWIDPASFIDHHILVETTKNIDGYRLSTFFHKDRGKRLDAGPIWDYNLSLGNANYLEGWLPAGWYYALISTGDYPWFPRLFQDPEFRQEYADRWAELREGDFRTETVLADVDDAALLLEEAAERNFDRWNILGSYVWPNWFVAGTWEEELEWMKDWLVSRLEWIDSTFIPPPRFDQETGLVDIGTEVRILATRGTVWYTTDGSDPRLPGGGISPRARSLGSADTTVLVASGTSPEARVLVPLNDALGRNWTGVSFDDGSWTASRSGLGIGYEAGSGYETYIDHDVSAAMQGGRPGAYIRIRFTVERPAEIGALTLRMRYDDGFIAYLNGDEIARANAPAGATADSTATALHDDASAVTFESIDVSARIGSLRAGTNVLAVHGLNESTGSSDFLIEPELVASLSFDAEPIVVTGPVHIIARASTGDVVWSGKSTATFVTDPDLPVRISELMYHPRPLPEDSPYDADDLEYVELVNIGNVPIDLAGVRFVEGIEYTFAGVLVPAGGYVLIVRDLEAFEWFWGEGLPIAGEYKGNLSNGGELLRLVDGAGAPIHEFAWDDAWHPVTDGAGFSLSIVDPLADPATWATPEAWLPSADVDGTPGRGEGGSTPRGLRRPGDVNADGTVDLSDAIGVLRLLFEDGAVALPCGGAIGDEANTAILDVNGDSGTNLSDAVALLDWLFLEGSAPARGTSCIVVSDCTTACP